MSEKPGNQILFTSELKWPDNKHKRHATAICQPVSINTPPEFGGKEDKWSAGNLFLSSITTCYLSMLLAFSKKMKFKIFRFECSITGQVELEEGKYKFTYIHMYPKVNVKDEAAAKKAELAMEKTQNNCLISTSLNAQVIYHGEVVIGAIQKNKTNTTIIKRKLLEVTPGRLMIV